MDATGRPDGTRPGIDWDPLIEQLQSLRRSAGEPSYAEIARRIGERRVADGASPHAARIARTTVYDAFRTGRTRVNLDLVREIVEVLGADDGRVDDWVARCVDPADAPVADPVADPPEPAPARRSQVALLLIACVAVNLVGRALVDFLDLPIYLDMVGTAVAAIALGPWRGAAVGTATNLIGVLSSGPASIPFALVNVVGALMWGYGVRHGLGRTLQRFLLLNVLVALACTLVAVPILLLFYDGTTGHGQDTITGTFLDLTHTLLIATGLSNVVVSLADKVISGFVALVIVSALPAALRRAALPVLAAPSAPGGDVAGRLV